MTQLVQTQPRYPTRLIASIALAAAVVGGIVGSGVQALVTGSPAGGLSTRDQAVLESGQAWEARYRQMYPASR